MTARRLTVVDPPDGIQHARRSPGRLRRWPQIALRLYTGLREVILIDARNRMSLSKLQPALWTVLVLSAFLTIAMFSIHKDPMANPLDIGVPPQVWGLLEISTTSFVTAATIKSQKKNLNVT